MTNMQSIAGGAAWMLLSGLLFFAALTPVSVEQRANVEVAAAAPASAAA